MFVSHSKDVVLVTDLAQTHTALDHISTKMHKRSQPCVNGKKQNRKALNSHCVDIVLLCVGGSAYTQAVLLVNMGPSDLPLMMFVFQGKAALMTN